MPKRALLAVALGAGIAMTSCAGPRGVPKLVQADGVAYVACGGALWIENEVDPKDLQSRSYEVMFKDDQGIQHELKRVRMLSVTSLPNHSPSCAKSR